MRKTLLLLVPMLLLNACSWGITQDEGARNIRTAWNGDVSACRDLGKVTVSVMDHIGPIDRSNITVADELEVLARNEAAKMHADTIKPLADPANGSQPWGAYRCNGKMVDDAHAPETNAYPPAASSIKTQTFPVHGG